MKHFLFSLFVLFFISINAYSQSKEQIDSIFSGYTDVPGCAAAVYKDGKIIFSEGYGMANLDYDIKIRPETVFDIGSISKQFTAACVYILSTQGKLSLDDPVRKYIPELPEYTDTVITIKHLIYHTSGIRSYPALMFIAGIPFQSWTTEEHVRDLIFRQKELNFNPGEEFLYNNSGYFLLAEIVRRVSGQDFGKFAKENIFDPLEMSSTFFYENPKQVIKNRAIGYLKKDSVTYEREDYFEAVVAGPGGLHTTVEDFQKWDENFYSEKVGGKDFYENMHTRGILNNGDTLDYAFGLMFSKYKGLNLVSHSGGWGAFVAQYVRIPEYHMSFVGFSNSGMNMTGKVNKMIDLYMKDKMEEETAEGENKTTEINKKLLKKYEGRYKLDPPGLVIEASIENDSLKMYQTWNKSEYKLSPSSDTTFILKGMDNLVFSFRKIDGGKAQVMHIFQNGNHSDWAREEALPKKVKVKDYEGEYYSDELLCTYKFYEENDTLILKIKYNDPLPLELSGEDEFSAGGGKVKFIRNEKGEVTGLKVDAGRVRNLKFIKQ